MPVFANRMRDFTDQLKASIEHRSEALDVVHEATRHLLGDAQKFMGEVAREHESRADQLQEMLCAFRGDLADRVETMRQQHRTSRHEMRTDLRNRLDAVQAARHQDVQQMRQKFHEARQEVAEDIRAAANLWREFTLGREGA